MADMNDEEKVQHILGLFQKNVDTIAAQAEQLTQTQQALDKAVEALKWYADIENTCYDVDFDRSYEYWYDGNPDACRIAKAALASIKE